jgi:penicillin amidase
MTLKNIFFQGKLPRFLGFDRGPIAVPGGRASVWQSQVFRSGGRHLAVSASYRFITDLAADAIHTNLCGGPSDRRFSRWYASDLANWQRGAHKRIAPSDA